MFKKGQLNKVKNALEETICRLEICNLITCKICVDHKNITFIASYGIKRKPQFYWINKFPRT